MKFFKKKRLKLPRPGAVERMILKNLGRTSYQRYLRELRIGRELPIRIREVTLARLHPQNRQNIIYYPDIRNFQIVLEPNRSLPIRKFLDMFRNMIDEEILEASHFALTNYRVEFYKDVDEWMQVYADENVHTCMSGIETVRCYVHPENNLALATLYAPGGSRVIARTIVNTEEHWYVRLFGDNMLVTKLQEMGYNRLGSPPNPFKMYGFCANHYASDKVIFPYFDFPHNSIQHFPDTYNPVTGMVEVTVS
jgi:hypothetical protein